MKLCKRCKFEKKINAFDKENGRRRLIYTVCVDAARFFLASVYPLQERSAIDALLSTMRESREDSTARLRNVFLPLTSLGRYRLLREDERESPILALLLRTEQNYGEEVSHLLGRKLNENELAELAEMIAPAGIKDFHEQIIVTEHVKDDTRLSEICRDERIDWVAEPVLVWGKYRIVIFEFQRGILK